MAVRLIIRGDQSDGQSSCWWWSKWQLTVVEWWSTVVKVVVGVS